MEKCLFFKNIPEQGLKEFGTEKLNLTKFTLFLTKIFKLGKLYSTSSIMKKFRTEF